jgi:acyl-CoA thioesterase-1
MRILLMVTLGSVLAASAGSGAAPRAGLPQGAGRVPAQASAPAPLTIVALGDSLTSGHRLTRAEAYPALLEAELSRAGFPVTVVNHGVNGDTTTGAARRLDAALAEHPQVLIVALGANDGLRGVPVAQVRTNLERIIEGAQARGVSVLLVGMEALPLYGWQYTIDFHHVFPDLSAKYVVPLVPFMLNGVLGNPDLMSADGIHPNAAGAATIAANILPHLRRLVTELIAGTRSPDGVGPPGLTSPSIRP